MRACRVREIALLLSIFAWPAAADDSKEFADRCQSIKPPKAKIEGCLALMQGGKMSKAMFPAIYSEIAFAWYELDDFDRAAEYTRTQIKIASENMKEELASGKLSSFGREAWPKQMSWSYKRLGQYLAFGRLRETDGGSEKAFNYAKAELSSYNAAISYDRENHLAYMARAEVQSLLCNASQAAMDAEAALRIARARDDDRAYREYKFKVLPGCVAAWQSR
ncbi:tetratricopeptide (TPR) repeat protein [Bradyrhizobium sp. LB7.2]